jgi:hypothetical protein
MLGVVGTSMRGSNEDLITLHDAVALSLFSISFFTVVVFVLQRKQQNRVVCIILLFLMLGSLGFVAFGSALVTFATKPDSKQLGEFLLPIGEVVYIGLYSILMAILFHNAIETP